MLHKKVLPEAINGVVYLLSENEPNFHGDERSVLSPLCSNLSAVTV